MAVAEYGLPPGAYERNGKYYRTITKTGVDDRGEWEEEEERQILLPIATDEQSITQSRERAARLGLDFYDPTVAQPKAGYEPEVIGWLDRGRKRERDWAWNLGSGEPSRKRRYKQPVSETTLPGIVGHINGVGPRRGRSRIPSEPPIDDAGASPMEGESDGK